MCQNAANGPSCPERPSPGAREQRHAGNGIVAPAWKPSAGWQFPDAAITSPCNAVSGRTYSPPWCYMPPSDRHRRPRRMTHECAAAYQKDTTIATWWRREMARCALHHVLLGFTLKRMGRSVGEYRSEARGSGASGWCLRLSTGQVQVPVRPHALDCIVPLDKRPVVAQRSIAYVVAQRK